MQVALSELKKNFSYIVNEYHIPENIFISKTAAFAVDYMAKFLPFVGGVTAIDDILGSKKKKITSEDIPDDIMDTNKEKFYKMLSRYCDDRGYTESELYNKACVSKAVYSNIRSMAIKGQTYTPSKITVMSLCIALHLTLSQTQEMLSLVGYSLSNNIVVDKIVSWCLEQTKFEYDVLSLNEVIYEKIGESPFAKLN